MDEKVLVIARKNLPQAWLGSQVVIKASKEQVNQLTSFIEWQSRVAVETNESFKQIIPYLILQNPASKQIAMYQRAGNEKRLHGLYSVGLGGHINPVDQQNKDTFMDIVVRASQRELAEELCGFEANNFAFKGIINEEITKVGRTHLGFVFLINMAVQPKPGEELKNFQWIDKEFLHGYRLELWSEMALQLLN